MNGNPSVEPGYLADDSKFSTLRSALAIPLEGLAGVVGVLALYHAERDAVKRAEIVQRQLDTLQRFQGPRDKLLLFRDITKLFEEMKDHR